LTGSRWAERIVSEGCVARVDGWRWGQIALGGLDQRGAAAGQAVLGVEDFDPRSKVGVLASRGFLIGETGKPTQMAPVGAGDIAAIGASQLSADLGRYGRLQSRSADVNPSLEMTGTGLQHQARLKSIGTHGVDDLRVSPIQIEEDVAGIAAVGIRPKVNIESLAIATTQKAYNRRLRELIGRPESLSRAAASGNRMNQTEQIKFVGHGRDLAADGVQGDKQSALHARNCNMLPKTFLAKPEVSTLQKTGSFYFALTAQFLPLTFFLSRHIIT
jgi:hypothetical protein